MAKYPNEIYTPRIRENRAGVAYDPTKRTVIFAEDFKKGDDEIIAIQNELGLLPKGSSANVAERIRGIRSLADAIADTLIIKGNRVGIGTPTPTEKLDVDGNIRHTGLVMTNGTNVDQIREIIRSITLTTAWQDAGINGADLATGSYIVNVYVHDWAVGGDQWRETYSGIMSWYSGITNSAAADEILLHRAGHAPNAGRIHLRTLRTWQPGFLKLQIRGETNNTGPSNYVFKFRRLI